MTSRETPEQLLARLRKQFDFAATLADPELRRDAYHRVVSSIWVRKLFCDALTVEQLDAFNALDALAKARRDAASAEVNARPIPALLETFL